MYKQCIKCMNYYWDDRYGYALNGFDAYCEQYCGTQLMCPKDEVEKRQKKEE